MPAGSSMGSDLAAMSRACRRTSRASTPCPPACPAPPLSEAAELLLLCVAAKLPWCGEGLPAVPAATSPAMTLNCITKQMSNLMTSVKITAWQAAGGPRDAG